MATATKSDFVIFNPEFQSGLWEGLAENTNAFNQASAGAIRLVQQERKGEYVKEALWTDIADLTSRRDNTSTSAATAVKPAQSTWASVKLNRKIGPIEHTLDALRKAGVTQQEASFILGQQVGRQKMKDMLDAALRGLVASISGGSTATTFDATGESTKSITTGYLVKTLAKMGDASDRVVAWVMHSTQYFDLVGSQVTDKVTNVADRVIYGGTPGTLNRPVVIVDNSVLINPNGTATDSYNVLGLVAGAATVEESEQSDIVTDIVTGLENIVLRIQGEYAMNIAIRGATWDIANGGANPSNSALATSSNWDFLMDSRKDGAGVLGVFHAA